MKKILFLIFALTFPLLSHAQFDKMPKVKIEQFNLGRYWIWEYTEGPEHTKVSSCEKYTVVKLRGSIATIEMSTFLPPSAGPGACASEDKDKYRPHHLIVANLKDCEKAYLFHRIVTTMPYKFFYNQSTNATPVWVETGSGATATSPFEEKFNCNGLWWDESGSDLSFRTDLQSKNNQNLFAQLRTRPMKNYFSSWYLLDAGPNQAIAYFKIFNPKSKFEYQFRLVESGQDDLIIFP